MGVVAGVAALWLLRGVTRAEGSASGEVPLENPFSLRSAIRFALVFAAVLLVVELMQTYLPGRGLYAVAALAGLSDVDAITLSMASCVGRGECAAQTGVVSIVIAALSNTLLKSGMVVALAAPSLRRPILGATAAILAAGAVALAVAPIG